MLKTWHAFPGLRADVFCNGPRYANRVICAPSPRCSIADSALVPLAFLLLLLQQLLPALVLLQAALVLLQAALVLLQAALLL